MNRTAYLTVVPDLVVEVLSPSTARRDRTKKKRSYATCGVGEYWLVDPVAETVEIFLLEGREYGEATIFRAGRVSSRALPQLDMTVEELFVDLG